MNIRSTMENNNSIQVYIVDDDEDDYFITSSYLKEIREFDIHPVWCPRYEDAILAIQEKKAHLYLVDYRLGAKTGLDLLREAVALGCEEPIVLLTGRGNAAIDKMAMETGASDYLVKPELSAEKLERCVRYSLERAKHLRALSLQEKKYRSIFEQSRDAVFLVSWDLKLIDCNRAFEQLLGESKSLLLERQNGLLEFLPNQTQRSFIEEQLQRLPYLDDYEVQVLSSADKNSECLLSLTRVTDQNKGHYYQGILHDITHLKKAERSTLIAEKMASTERLVRTLAHEVRNPLNNIQLSLEVLNGNPNIQEQEQPYIAIIERNSRRIGDLITQLLQSSKPAEAQMSQHTLQKLIDDSLEAALDRINLQKIKLRLNYPQEPCMVLADRDKIKMALLNIIINAVEAMEMGNGELSILIENQAMHYRVSIADNGCGIDPALISRLFEPYFTAKRNGMGLGLATTLNILQVHKVQIEVESAVGKGTTFFLDFPRLEEGVDLP